MNQNFTMAYLSVTKSWLACRSPLRHWWRMAGTNSKVEIQGEAYEDRNKRLKRPISPHLTIHKFHNNMAQSIMHRLTGAALNGLLYSLAIGAVILPESIPHYLEMLEGHELVIFGLKGIVAFPFSYHFFNGIRHLSWDVGYFWTPIQVDKSGNRVVVASLIVGTLLTLYHPGAWILPAT